MPIYVPNTLAQQLAKACARAVKSTNTMVCHGREESGLLAILSSAQDARVTYSIHRDQTSGTLRCSCPVRVICKHIGLLLVRYGVPYYSTGRPSEIKPVVPDSNYLEPAACGPNSQDEELCSFTTTEGSEASVALMLAERSERTLVGQAYSQEERLKALAYLPVAIASYAVVMGPAHGWQWHQAKEEHWDRYQACRSSQCWY